MNYLILIILILVSILFSAFFSGMEIAYITANKLRIEIDKKQKKIFAGIVSYFSKVPSRFIATMLVAVEFGIKIYAGYLRKIKQLNESALVVSLKKKHSILSHYVKQLNFYLLIFAPLGFVIGFGFALKDEALNAIQLLISAAIALAFLLLFIWLGRKYIHALYGKHLKSIEEIYQHLIEKE